MPSKTPFVDSVTGELNIEQIISESVPLAKLIGLFVGFSLVPFSLVYLALGNSTLGAIVALLGQFILALGAGIVLIYSITRGMQLADY